MVAPPPIALKFVHWARCGPKFAYKIDGCDASYTAKYNLIQHLWTHHNLFMESDKPERPSTWEEGMGHQDHMAMNARVLNNSLAWYHCNE
jgi:hypothetical protein